MNSIQERNVCICHKISKETIYLQLEKNQVKTIEGIIKKTNATTGCGSCLFEIQKIINEFKYSKNNYLFKNQEKVILN